MNNQNRNAHRATRRKKSKKKSLNAYFLLFAFCVIVFATYIFTLSLHPIGVVEFIKSQVAISGQGTGYSISLNDGKPLNTLGDNDKYLVVSASSVNAYNKSGKTIFEKKHSLTNPVVKLSETRYLLYGQGERSLSVNTFSNTLYNINFESGIVTSAISDSGVFAVATKKEGYSSSVSVFDKSNQKIFEWLSHDETVNALALSDNGKSLAVATLKAENGKFVSNFYVLRFDSADPIMKKTYKDDVIYQIYSTTSTTFAVVLSNNIDFLNYRNDKVSSHSSEYTVSLVKVQDGKLIAVRTVAANQEESIIEIYSLSGKLKKSFKVDNNVTDFAYNSNKIYLLGSGQISKFNSKGEMLANIKADYDTLFIESISANSVACICNSSIDKAEFNNAEE